MFSISRVRCGRPTANFIEQTVGLGVLGAAAVIEGHLAVLVRYHTFSLLRPILVDQIQHVNWGSFRSSGLPRMQDYLVFLDWGEFWTCNQAFKLTLPLNAHLLLELGQLDLAS